MVGRTVSHYHITQQLGEGGMGVVYQARDTRLNRLVALKFLAARLLENPAARTRFFQEAQAISALNHPNIATLYDVGDFEGAPFLVLEYLSGGTLASRLAATRARGDVLSMADTLRHGLDIGAGLAHAHRSGIVHRDVKSGNIMFGTEGSLKLTDFGLSKFRGALNVTQSGGVVGTILYMSPEQLEAHDADYRSDIFSFGVVLYEMAAGRLPFDGPTPAAIVRNILEGARPPLRVARPDVSPELEHVVERALARDPAERYQSADEVLAELRELAPGVRLDAAPVPVSQLPTVSMAPLVQPPARSRRRIWWVAALVVLAALLGLVRPVREAIGRWLPGNRVPAARQLAVLPFTNIGEDQANQAFTEGLVEILTNSLTQIERFHGSLWVVPANELRVQKVRTATAARRMFNANLALTGSVQRLGNTVHLMVNLVDTATLRQLRSFDLTVDQLPRLQDEAVFRVASMLELELGPQHRRLLSAGRKPASGAYADYVAGYGFLRHYGRLEDTDHAIELFRKAIARDSSYALPFAGLCEAYWRKFDLTKDVAWVGQAQANCGKALALEPNLPEAHATMALLYRGTGRYEEAVAESKRALALDPFNMEAHARLGRAYESLQRLTEAENAYKKAIELKPGYWNSYNVLGSFYYRCGRYTDALQAYQRVPELTPDNPVGYNNVGAMYHLMGRLNEAESMFRKSISVMPTPKAYTNLGTIYYFQGRYADAVPMMEKAIELGTGDSILWGNLADACLRTPGLSKRASEAYRRAAELAKKELDVNPRDAELLSSLAVYEASIGGRAEALAHVQDARQLAPENTNVLFKSALVFELTGRRAEALGAVRAALEKDYALIEVIREPRLEALRKDSRFTRILASTRRPGARN